MRLTEVTLVKVVHAFQYYIHLMYAQLYIHSSVSIFRHGIKARFRFLEFELEDKTDSTIVCVEFRARGVQ